MVPGGIHASDGQASLAPVTLYNRGTPAVLYIAGEGAERGRERHAGRPRVLLCVPRRGKGGPAFGLTIWVTIKNSFFVHFLGVFASFFVPRPADC